MFGSLKLGKLFGIDFFIHSTFWLLPLFVFLSGGGTAAAGFEVAVAFAVFGCVALHEVGHALAARYYGIDTQSITLYPIGGVAALDRMPERPLHEVVVALAGPAVNVVIAGGLLIGLLAREWLLPGTLAGSHDPAEVFVGRLLLANLVLVAFNLLPAFPMDGGRVLRAVLSLGLSRLDATRAAAGVGAVLAVGFGLVGWYVGNVGLMLAGGVVFLLGQAELTAVRAQAHRREVRRRAEVYADDLDTGWEWDPRRGVWVQWQDGVPVRVVPGD